MLLHNYCFGMSGKVARRSRQGRPLPRKMYGEKRGTRKDIRFEQGFTCLLLGKHCAHNHTLGQSELTAERAASTGRN